MKTEEDEAFDDLAKRQGAWGGGFQAKRKAAADKFIAAEERKVGERYGYVPKLHPSEWMDAQPAQEPPSEWAGIKAILDEYGLQAIDFVADFKAALAQPAQERQWIWLSDADIRETIDSICQYSGDYDEFLCKKIERKIKELNT